MRSAFDDAAVIDTSAALALHDPRDQFHRLAIQQFTRSAKELFWVVFDITTHETYTRARYWKTYQAAMEHYNFLRQDTFRLIRFLPDDERDAERLLAKYAEHALSYHDRHALAVAHLWRRGLEQALLAGRRVPVVMLIPADISTRWWYECVARDASEVRFLVGRVKFRHPDGSPHSTKRSGGGFTTPSAIVVYRPSGGPPRYSYMQAREAQ